MNVSLSIDLLDIPLTPTTLFVLNPVVFVLQNENGKQTLFLLQLCKMRNAWLQGITRTHKSMSAWFVFSTDTCSFS